MKNFYRFVAMVIITYSASVLNSSAQIPRKISIQGVITDTSSKPADDGIYVFTLKIYDAVNSDTPLFTEEIHAEVIKGLFTIILGDKTPIPQSLLFDKQYYVGISYNGKPEFFRLPLVSVPFSITANTAQGLTPTASGAVLSLNGQQGNVVIRGENGVEVLSNSDGELQIGLSQHKKELTVLAAPTEWVLAGNAASTTDWLGTSNNQPLVIKTNNTERMRVLSTGNGNVGIGTTNPAERLEVAGNIQVAGNMLVKPNGSNTGEFRLLATSGTNYTALKSPSLSTNITYTLPASQGQNGTVLTNNGNGVLSWELSNTWDVDGNTATASSFIGTTNNQPLLMKVNNQPRLAIATNGALQRNDVWSRGTGAVDLQMQATSSQIANGNYAVISGGSSNRANGNYTVVGGGLSNAASAQFSSVYGGNSNSAGADYSTILGGNGLTFMSSATNSLGFLANSSSRTMTVSTPNIALYGNLDVWIGSNDGTTHSLKLFSNNLSVAGAFPGTTAKNVALKAPNNLIADYSLTLPSDAGSIGQVLTTDGNGVLIWTTASAGLTNFAESLTTSEPNSTVPIVRLVAAHSAANVDIALSPRGSGALTAQVATNSALGGNKRGQFAVDWQMSRSAAAEVASGNFSVLAGGADNSAGGDYSVIPGGYGLSLSSNAYRSFGFNANNGGGTRGMTINAANTAVWNNVDFWLTNNDNIPRSLRFYGRYNAAGNFPNGTKFVGFKAPNNISADVTWTLPDADGANGNFLKTDGNGVLTWSASSITGAATGDLTGVYPNPTIADGVITSSKIADYTIVNSDVSNTAAIGYSKLNLTGAIVNADVSSSAAIGYSKLNLTGAIVNADVSSSAAIGYSKLNLTGAIVNADVSSSAAIGYSKLNLTGAIVNTDVSSSAAIDYSKLNLTGAIVNADVSSSAAIGYSKLNLTGAIVNTDVSSSAAIGYSKLNLTGAIVNADVSSSAAIDYSKLNLTGAIVNADVSSSAAIGYSKLNLTGAIVNTDVSSSAAIDYSKLNLTGAIVNADVSNTAAIGYSKLNLTNSIVAGDITSGAVTGPKIGTDAVTTSKIADNTIQSSDLKDGDVQAIDLATNSVTTIKITDGNVTMAKLAQDGATSGQVIKWTGSAWSPSAVLANFTESVNTTSPNATVPIVQLLATNAATNVDIALAPKGTGALMAQIPDGTRAGGGDKRGQYAVDWQRIRSSSSAQVASGNFSVIGGGESNTSSGTDAVVGGGTGNTASSNQSTIAGGSANVASGQYATVAGGSTNKAQNVYAAIGGGQNNTANAIGSTINGGNGNSILINTGGSSSQSIIGAGQSNVIQNANFALIGGGKSNTITGSNASAASTSVIVGGENNVVFADHGAVGGGMNNTVGPSLALTADYSAIPGGRGLTLSGSGSFGFLGNNNSGTNNMTISAINTAVFGNTHLWLANNSNTASELRFYEANSTASGAFPPASIHYTAFKAGTQSADITYTLPPTTPTADGQVLSSTTSGGMSWVAIVANGTAAGGDLTGTYPNPTIADASVTSSKIADLTIVNADVSNTAAIAYSKLNLAGGIVNTDVSSSAAIGYSKLNLAGGIVNTDVSSSAAIGYSKLNLTGGIVNTDVGSSAAITYSKLNLAGAIINADVSSSAAIAYSKLNLTNSIVAGDITSGAVTGPKIGTDAVTTSKIADNTIQSSDLKDGDVQAVDLATNSVTTIKINDGNVTMAKLAQAGATIGQSLIWDGTSWNPSNTVQSSAAATVPALQIGALSSTTGFQTFASKASHSNFSGGSTLSAGSSVYELSGTAPSSAINLPTSIPSGTIVFVINATNNSFEIAVSGGNYTLSQNRAIQLLYSGTAWYPLGN
jgi:hypothetical protein